MRDWGGGGGVNVNTQTVEIEIMGREGEGRKKKKGKKKTWLCGMIETALRWDYSHPISPAIVDLGLLSLPIHASKDP